MAGPLGKLSVVLGIDPRSFGTDLRAQLIRFCAEMRAKVAITPRPAGSGTVATGS